MAKLTISQQEVNTAANEIRAEGKTPGWRSVRERLGNKGAPDTIVKMLKVWQAAEPMPDIDLGEPLPPAALEGLQQAFSDAKAGVAAKYEKELLVARADRAQALADLETHHSEHEELKTMLDASSASVLKLGAANDELKKQVDALSESDKQRQAAEKRAAAAEATIAALQGKLQEQEALAKATTEAHGREVQALKSAHADALAKLQAEAKAEAEKARAALAKVQQELAEQAQARSKAEAQGVELGKDLKTAEGLLSGLRADLGKAQSGQKAAEEKAGATALELSNAQGQMTQLKDLLKERAALVESLQQRVFKLEAQLPPAEPEKTAPKAGKR